MSQQELYDEMLTTGLSVAGLFTFSNGFSVLPGSGSYTADYNPQQGLV